MTFEVSYTGDATTIKGCASNPEMKGDEFYDKMDALANEIKQLKKKRDKKKKVEEMLELCREYFDDEAKIEGFGPVDYEFQNSDGRIEVDGEEIKMGKRWENAEWKQDSQYSDAFNKLFEQDWVVIYYVQNKGVWVANIEEDEFDKKKLNWKDSMVHYGDIPLDDEISGRRPIDETISLRVELEGLFDENHYF